jgi:hypothetical protein
LRTGELVQAITVTNLGSAAIDDDLALVLDGLPEDVQLLDSSTVAGARAKSMRLAERGGALRLEPGGQATVIVRFLSRTKAPIRYRPRVVRANAQE